MYFEAKDGTLIYMGRDKFENEDLIKHGRETDLWFHVDNLSSAHVYLRLQDGTDWEAIPEETLKECAQLVKANSIQGCKMNDVPIVYTPWSNLKKTARMLVGQVGFHDDKLIRKCVVDKKDNDVIRRLNKTKREEDMASFVREKEDWDKEQRKQERMRKQERQRHEKEQASEHQRMKQLQSYSGIMDTDAHMTSAKDMGSQYQSAEDYEDDFM